MPICLINAPGTFQSTIDVILAAMKWQFVLVNLDDIAIYFKSPDEHIGLVRRVLRLLNDAGVALRLKKCKFVTETCDYLGHVIRPRGLDIPSHSTDAICGLQLPTNLTDLRSFLGFCHVFRCSFPNFARGAALLNQNRRKEQQSTFGTLSEEEVKSLNTLKCPLISPPSSPFQIQLVT